MNYTIRVFEESEPEGSGEGPAHGFRGEPGQQPQLPQVPEKVSIAVSRQAGARGGTLGRRVGRELGWEVYTQEILGYVLREESTRRELYDRLNKTATQWAESRIQELIETGKLVDDPNLRDLVHLILAIGAKGNAVFIGRGSGLVLPEATTLNVRIVAPLEDRVAYMAQWLRLTQEEAAEAVRQRDQSRSEFLAANFHHDETDISRYDLILNSRLLGEEACAALILQAAKSKERALAGPQTTPDFE